MTYNSASSDVKGKALDVQLYIAQCSVLAHNLLYVSEPKPGGASFHKSFTDTKTEHFLAGGSSLFGPIFELSKRGILVAQNHLWYDDSEIGLFITKALDGARRWYQPIGNTILGTILMFSPLTVSVAHYFANEGMKTNVKLDLDVVVALSERFLKNSTTDDCIHLTHALTKNVSTDILPSDKDEDDFSSFIRIYEHQRTNLYDFTKFYEERDLVFYEMSHNYKTTIATGFKTLTKVYEEEHDLMKAISHTYLTLLAERKDTHIAKRFGNEIASEIQQMAKNIVKAGGIFTVDGTKMIDELDDYLRNSRPKKINPGSIADITTTTILLALLDGYRP